MRARWSGHVAGVAIVLFVNGCSREDPAITAQRAQACAGPPIKTIEDRQAAYEKGYAINQDFNCIDRQSYDLVQRQEAEYEQARKKRAAMERNPPAAVSALALQKAREGFVSSVSAPASGTPLPDPPPNLFVRSDYRNPQGRMLAAYVTP